MKKFRERDQYFPFVSLPQEFELDSMLQSRPYLALAIFTAMSNDHLELQTKLDTKFRREVTEKAVVNAEKSLDILQALLVYLAW